MSNRTSFVLTSQVMVRPPALPPCPSPSMVQYVKWSLEKRGKDVVEATPDAFYQDQWCQSLFHNWLHTITSRTNTLTGVIYRCAWQSLPANPCKVLQALACDYMTATAVTHRAAAYSYFPAARCADHLESLAGSICLPAPVPIQCVNC
jgi:hypothetical protein